MDILNEMSKMLNFTYNMTNPADFEWGAPTKNSTFTGMMGGIASGDYDFILGSLISDTRLQVR